MANAAYSYDDPFRPIFEYYPAYAWVATGILALVMAILTDYPKSVMLFIAGASFTLAGIRGVKALQLHKHQTDLTGQDLEFMTRQELRDICHKRIKAGEEQAIFLGYGFTWSQEQAQVVHVLKRNNPEKLLPPEDQDMGLPWIHGIGMHEEKEIWLPLEHTAGHTLLVGTTRAGKALPLTAKIHTPTGWITMADVRVGTLVSTPDGGFAPVTGVYPQGLLNTFVVMFMDGRFASASGDHLWEIFDETDNNKGNTHPKILNTLELIRLLGTKKGIFSVRLPKPVPKPHAVLKISPYRLGVWLAADSETLTNIEQEPLLNPEVSGRMRAEKSRTANDLALPQLREVGLGGRMLYEVFIPDIYMESSIEQRIALLQGLLDVSGTVVPSGNIVFYSNSQPLLTNIQTLVWSLGGTADVKYKCPENIRKGYKGNRVIIYLPDPSIAFHIKSKKDKALKLQNKFKSATIAIREIYDGTDELCQCIKVDHPDELFITDNYVVTHNTRVLDSIVAQAVDRGEPVLIWDPKGDKGLMDAAQKACIASERPNDFVYFHPAFPEKSWRIDPLANFSRETELATRIASLIASESSSDPFTAFSQKILTNLVAAMLMIHTKPTIKLLKHYVDSGPEKLVVKASEVYFEKHYPGVWRDMSEEYTRKAKKNDREISLAYIQFYRDVVMKEHPSMALDGIYSDLEHEKNHLGKMTASLSPVLTMLTAGPLGDLLSPDPDNHNDLRPITNFAQIIRNRQVCYIGLDSLSDNMVGSALGTMFVSDLSAVSGNRYNYGTLEDLPPVNLIIDEAAELVSDKMIQLLNKSGGAKFRLILATQTFADFAAKIGSADKARQTLGNLNNVIALRIIDAETQQYVTESLPEVYVRHIEYAQQTDVKTSDFVNFGFRTSESMKETAVPLVDAQLFGCIPNLQFFAKTSAGQFRKCRMPILIDDETP